MKTKRVLAWFVALCMVMCMTPVTSFANETATDGSDEQINEVEYPEPAEQDEALDEIIEESEEQVEELADTEKSNEKSEPVVLRAANATAPTEVWVAPSEANKIPVRIDVFKATKTGVTPYQLFLPGDAVIDSCFLSWNNNATVTVDGVSYASGECPIAPVNTEKTFTFKNGNTTLATWKIITYKGSNNDDVQRVFIEIDEDDGNPTITQMDSDKTVVCSGTIFINGAEYELSKMKGRGNASWDNAEDKKPYNITLGSKIKFPGIDSDKTKKWSLLSEVLDRSLLCNRSGYHLAHELGVGQDTTSADVWMQGEYQGCYTVTPKTDSFVTKNGFMIEQDNYKEPAVANGGDPQFSLEGLNSHVESSSWTSSYNRITVKKMGDDLLGYCENGDPDESPENMNAKANDIKVWLQKAWNAIRSSNGYNSEGKYYTDYIDIESFAKMYLMHEYIKSYDVCAGSILFHRNGQTDDDKLIAGPLWDLDNAMGSTYSNSFLGDVSDRRSAQGSFIESISNYRNYGEEYKTSIYKKLGKHEDFMAEVKKQYNKYHTYFDNLDADTQQMIDDIQDSAVMNHIKVNDIGNGTGKNNHYYDSRTTLGSGQYSQTYEATTSWDKYASNLKTYITKRSLWFANNYYDPDYVCNHEYNAVVTEPTCKAGGFTTYTCKWCGESHTDNETPKIAHNYVDGICTACGEQLLTATISCSVGASVTVYETKTFDGTFVENATSANPRDGESGLIDCFGEGQINFVVNLSSGYALLEEGGITIEPASAYNKLKGPSDTGVENGYRITKVKGDLMIAINAECLHNSIIEHKAKAATCTETGNNVYWSCDNCGKYFADAAGSQVVDENSWVIPATGHTEEVIPAVSPTCTKQGSTAGKKCLVCGEILVEPEAIDALGHDWSGWEVTTEPGCTTKGEKHRTCSRCHEEQTAEIDALGHDYKVVEGSVKPASCTEDGKEADQKCSRCQDLITGKTIDALGHDYKVVEGSAKPASCTADGKEADQKCSRCQDLITGKTIDALGHDWSGWEVTTEPGCTTKGEKHRTCSRCHEEQTEEIDAAHKWMTTYTVDKEATTTAEGSKSIHCSVCGAQKPNSTVAIAKLEPAETKAADGTDVGKGASASVAEKAILNSTSDEGPAGTKYGVIKLKSTKQTKTSLTLSWSKVTNAKKYIIYGNKCGTKNKMEKVATATGMSIVLKKVAGKTVTKGTYYKFIIVALDKNNTVITTSKVIHIGTKGGKAGNHKSVSVKKSIIKKAKNLKMGQSLSLKARAVKASGPKVMVHRGLTYESSNTKIATVSKKGVVKAKKKGACYVYAYAQDGVCKAIKIVVK